jgi:hypothetical protein
MDKLAKITDHIPAEQAESYPVYTVYQPTGANYQFRKEPDGTWTVQNLHPDTKELVDS